MQDPVLRTVRIGNGHMTMAPHILLVGCGGWGKLILRDLKGLGARVTVVANSRRSRGFALEYAADAIIPSLPASRGDIDGIVIAAPSTAHIALIVQLCRFDVPVFVEKPLTCDADEARMIASTYEGQVFVMDKWRYHSGIDRLRQIAQSQQFGPVLGLRSRRLGWSMTHNEVDPIWNLLPHDFSICLHILGKIPPLKHAFSDGLGPPGGGVFAHLSDGDVTVTIEASAYHPVNNRSVILACAQGTVQLADSYHDHLFVRIGEPGNRDAREEKWPLSADMPLRKELQVFCEFLDGGPAPMSTAKEGAATVEAIVAVRRAAGLGN